MNQEQHKSIGDFIHILEIKGGLTKDDIAHIKSVFLDLKFKEKESNNG